MLWHQTKTFCRKTWHGLGTGLLVLTLAGVLVINHPTQANAAENTATPSTSSSTQLSVQGKLFDPGLKILQKIEAANAHEKLGGQFYLVDQDVLNAWTDGKDVYMSKKLWETLTTTDQRAFVIGHELSHKALHHVEKNTLRQVGFGSVLRLLSRNHPKTALVSALGAKLLDQKFSRGDEYQADNLGLQMMGRAGYQPKAAVEVLDILMRESPNTTPEFLSSHPLSRSRIQALLKNNPNLIPAGGV
jgi:predicted Zn-dependent protease